MRKLITMKFILYFFILWGASVFSAAPNYSYLSFLNKDLSSLSLKEIAQTHSKEIIDFIVQNKQKEKIKIIFQRKEELIKEVAAANPSYFFENIEKIKRAMQVGAAFPIPYPLTMSIFSSAPTDDMQEQAHRSEILLLLKSGIFGLYANFKKVSDFICHLFSSTNNEDKRNVLEFILDNAPSGCFFASIIHAVLKHWIEWRRSLSPEEDFDKLFSCYFKHFNRYWAPKFEKKTVCDWVDFFYQHSCTKSFQEGFKKSLDSFLFTIFPSNALSFFIKEDEINRKKGYLVEGGKEQLIEEKLLTITDGEGNNLACSASILLEKFFEDKGCSVTQLEDLAHLLEIWAKRKISFFQRNKNGLCGAQILVNMCIKITKQLFFKKEDNGDAVNISEEYKECKCSEKEDLFCASRKAHKLLEWGCKILNSMEKKFNSTDDIEIVFNVKNFCSYINEILALSVVRNENFSYEDFRAPFAYINQPREEREVGTIENLLEKVERAQEAEKANTWKAPSTLNELRLRLNSIYSPFNKQHFRATAFEGKLDFIVDELAEPAIALNIFIHNLKAEETKIEEDKIKLTSPPIEEDEKMIPDYLFAEPEKNAIVTEEDLKKYVNILKNFTFNAVRKKELLDVLIKISNSSTSYEKAELLPILPIIEALFIVVKDDITSDALIKLLKYGIKNKNFEFVEYLVKLAEEKCFISEVSEALKEKFKVTYLNEKEGATIFWLFTKYRIRYDFHINYYCDSLLNLISLKQDKMPVEFEELFDYFLSQWRGSEKRYYFDQAWDAYCRWFSELKNWGVDVIHFKGEKKIIVPRASKPFTFKSILDGEGCTWLHRLIIVEENDKFKDEINKLPAEEFTKYNKFSFLGVALRAKNKQLFEEICSYRIKKNLFINSEEVREFIKYLPPDLSSRDQILEFFESESFRKLLSLDQKAQSLVVILENLKGIPAKAEYVNFIKQVENNLEEIKIKIGERSYKEILEKKEEEIELLNKQLREERTKLYENKEEILKLSRESKRHFERENLLQEEYKKQKNIAEEKQEKINQLIKKLDSTSEIWWKTTSKLEEEEKKCLNLQEELQKEKQRCAEEVIKTEAQSKKLTEYISSLREISDLAKAENEGLLKKCKELEKFRHQFEENEKNPCSALEKDEKGSLPLKEELQKEKQRCAEEVIKTEEQNKKLTEYINSLKKNSDIAKAGTLISGLVFVESILEPLFKSRSLLKEEWRKGKSYRDKLSFITKEVYRTYKESIKSANPIFSRVTTSAITSVLFFCIAKHVDALSKA